MKTISVRALMAIALLTGVNLSASAGALFQHVTPSAKLGSSLATGADTGPSIEVVPMPAQLIPFEVVAMPGPMPEPMPAVIEDPAELPEPGTVATLAAGLALMAALARRRRAR